MKKKILLIAAVILIATVASIGAELAFRLLYNTAKIEPSVNEQTYYFKVEVGEGGTIPAGQADIINGKYKKGAQIDIEARGMPDYYFTNWTSSNSGTFADEKDSTTTFTMPGNDTVVTAHFAKSGQ